MKSTYYFSHDSNARHDIKVQALRSVYGVAGYGMYWILIEMLREQDNFKLQLNNKILFIALSREFQMSIDQVKQFINDCIYEFGLFICNEDNFWSDSLIERMKLAEVKRNANRENGIKGGRPKKQQEQVQEIVEEVKPIEDKPVKQKRNTEQNATIAQYHSDVEYLTDLLVDKLKNNNPNAKVPSNLDSWKKEIHSMIEIDKYKFEQIARVIEFSQSDDFWKSNILSAKKLREKIGTLILQMNRVRKIREEPESITDTYNRLLKYVNGEDDDDEQKRNVEIIDIDSIVV